MQVQREFSKQFTQKCKIGSGTFGQVKKCICKKTEKLCAVKTIDNVNGMNIQKIQEEANIMKNAKSDYSLQLLDHFHDKQNSQYILVMPYCKFGSLEKKLSQDWSLNSILSFLYQITQAFVDFSQKKIIHLDLKPQNILLKNPGQYVVCDFGCSRVIEDLVFSKNFLKLSMSKGLGTPEYAAPQIEKYNKANKYSDVWSLGVILYKMVYHKSPFQRKLSTDFGSYKTTFQGHSSRLQPVVRIIKNMLEIDKRSFWNDIKKQIFQILKVDDSIEIITSTSEYVEYVKNLSVLGTCLLHLIDRISTTLGRNNINTKPLIRTFLLYLNRLTQEGINTDVYYFFDQTRNGMRLDQKQRILQINKQIKQIIQDRQIQEPDSKIKLDQLLSILIRDVRKFAGQFKKLPQKIMQQINNNPQFQFFKVKRILQFITEQFEDNFTFQRKRYLQQTIKFLVYS